MLVILSHVLAFSTLFIASIWDLYTTDVPDMTGIAGVAGGITLHALHAYFTGSLDPLAWSLGIGAIFSLYGWGMYFLGLWGGADAFAMSVLGFAAPYSLEGTGFLHAADLFVNVMMVGFAYSILFAAYRALKSGYIVRKAVQKITEEERRIALEIVLAGVFSSVAVYFNLNGFAYFAVFVAFIFIYRFLKVLEEEAMSLEIDISELEPGDVIDSDILPGENVREKNMLGRTVAGFRHYLPLESGFLRDLEHRIGYPEVVGVTEEEIEKLAETGIEKVDVKTGLRFIPVFPVALVITDVLGGGITFLVTVL